MGTGTREQWEHIRVVCHCAYAYHFVIKYFNVLTNCCFQFRAYHLFALLFRNGPPSNYNNLCFIFAGLTAKKQRYASTQSPPPPPPRDSADEKNNIDFNVPPPVIIDLIEPHFAHGSSKGVAPQILLVLF
jgi:hypothetical protein